MRQRNDTANALHVSAWPTDDEPDRSPFDVQIGEEIDFPELLAGFTSLEPEELEPPGPESDAEPAPDTSPPKGKSRSKNADSADAAEGGDPR